MDFALTDTQTELAAVARRYLEDRYPPARVAALADAADHDAGAWPTLERLGWLDADLGPIELALLAQESGRALHPAPWLVTAALTLAVYRAAGTAPPGPATLADGSDCCRAARDGVLWRLDGDIPDVIDARAAREIVVAAHTEHGVALFAVRPDEAGISLTEHSTVDPLRSGSDLTLVRSPARLLVGAPAAEPLLRSVAYHASTLFACEGVGVADHALTSAVQYAKLRHQFGRPIGSYQAVSHLLAESYADLESARSLAYRAAAVLADGTEHPGEAVACAIHASRQAAVDVCAAAIQVAGGIGVTWEYPLHRWYRRALWLDAYHAGRPDPLLALGNVVLR